MDSIMTVRAPDKLQQELKKHAENQSLPRNALILQILREWVQDKQERLGRLTKLSSWLHIKKLE